ncbi:MAG: EthD family reductase [Arthrobacter sp.]|jgi:uncharacterized protein (TIGR02118 family)|nr:EthD family reductase [Arthrobacter sp.]
MSGAPGNEGWLKIVAVVKKRDDLSREEFLHEWHEVHPRLVRALPGLRQYRQNPSIEHHSAWPFDGIAELFFDSKAAIAAAYAGPEAKALFEHEERFLGEVTWSITQEREIEL